MRDLSSIDEPLVGSVDLDNEVKVSEVTVEGRWGVASLDFDGCGLRVGLSVPLSGLLALFVGCENLEVLSNRKTKLRLLGGEAKTARTKRTKRKRRRRRRKEGQCSALCVFLFVWG